jgi:hypothetical protein
MEKSFVDYEVSIGHFSDSGCATKIFFSSDFDRLSNEERFCFVCKELLALIQRSDGDFVLGEALLFIDYVHSRNIIKGFSFNDFEFWLNTLSGLDIKKNHEIRGKLVGRFVPREEYQRYFPVGSGLSFQGDHFVLGHASPDLDTTVASFWGWVDAFAAKVSVGLHYWIIPGGKLPSQIEMEMLFFKHFGTNFFSFLGAGDTECFSVVKCTDSKAASTATLRDFSNRQEGRLPNHIDVISVIDHHKSSVAAAFPSVVTIADVQSCNTLLAEISFCINDRYRKPFDKVSLEEQINCIRYNSDTPSSKRILQRLLQNQINGERRDHFFISPKREFLEYLQYLCAILDDTDFLAKVSLRDLECVKSLLNRLESLARGREVEIVDFDDIAFGENFVDRGVQKILKNPQMKFFCDKIFFSREKKEQESLYSMDIFSDTKELNAGWFVGQTKIFAKNFSLFMQQAKCLRKKWLLQARNFLTLKKGGCCLHMVSTLQGSDGIGCNKEMFYSHQDEIWVWSPLEEKSLEQLGYFLRGFSSNVGVLVEVDLIGDIDHQLEKVFLENTNFAVKQDMKESFFGEAFAILKFKAGAINSRKAQISPFLPTNL